MQVDCPNAANSNAIILCAVGITVQSSISFGISRLVRVIIKASLMEIAHVCVYMTFLLIVVILRSDYRGSYLILCEVSMQQRYKDVQGMSM